MPAAADMAAANRELTARITRLRPIGKIISIGAGLALAAVMFWLIADGRLAAAAVAGRRHGRVSSVVLMLGVAAGFAVPFFGLRALFKWLLSARCRSWIPDIAARHSVDPEKLRRMAEAVKDLG